MRGALSAEDHSSYKVDQDLAGAAGELARLTEQMHEVESWKELRDAEQDTFEKLASIRAAIAGEIGEMTQRLPSPAVTEPLPSAPGEPPRAPAKGQTRTTALTKAQQATVRRVAESRATVPDLTLSAVADVTELVAGLAPGVTTDDAVLRACALALREHPRANGAYRDATWETYDRVNVGLALENDETLVVPTVIDTDTLGLAELAARRADLAERTRTGRLSSPELSGATFTLWTLGDLAVSALTPVIVPPQAAALAAGGARETPVVRRGEVVPGFVLRLVLACDHRILYGRAAAAFLRAIAARLEDPATLSG